MNTLPGQRFSSTQTPVCLGSLAKSDHDGSVVETELALAIMNLALRGTANAGTFRRDLHSDLRAA